MLCLLTSGAHKFPARHLAGHNRFAEHPLAAERFVLTIVYSANPASTATTILHGAWRFFARCQDQYICRVLYGEQSGGADADGPAD